MEISERKKKILAAIVDLYISTAEPVGSKTIAQSAGLGFSSATIRNEMAELTAMGYLEQPHTSAGRIPSAAGYRLYVNELMHQHRLSIEETEAINRSLNQKIHELDQMLSDVGKLTSSLTNYPALALAAPAEAVTIKRFDMIYVDTNTFIIVAMLTNNTVKNKLVNLPFSVERAMVQKLATVFNASFTGLTEDRITEQLIRTTERAASDTYGLVAVVVGFVLEVLTETGSASAYVAGATNLLRQPEYRDPDKAHELMSYLSDSSHVLELPAFGEPESQDSVGDVDVRVLIGPENVADELKDSSVVMASYNAGDGTRGMIGVVGPIRMDYSRVAAKLSCIASGLSRMLTSGNELPPELQNKLIKGDDIDE
ncbi:MAG: heat-inducible transcriptional repressor HrcA [Candidatus Heteroscillospira sp.]